MFEVFIGSTFALELDAQHKTTKEAAGAGR
jgi:hypothetical protein